MRNNGVIAATQVVWQTFALLIVYRLSAQAAGVATLGAWSTAIAIAALITVADAGLTDVVVREVARAHGLSDWPRVKGLCRSVLRLVPLTVGLLGLFAFPAIAYLLHALTPQLGKTVILSLAAGSIASVWLTVIATGAAGVLEAFGRYDLKAAAALVGGVCSIAAAYVTAQIAPYLTIVVALVTGTVVNLTLLLGAGYRVLRRSPGEPRPLADGERRAMLRLGINARLGGLAILGLDPVIRSLLLRFGGAEAAGLYEIAYRVVSQLRAVFVASTQVIVPRLTRERARGATGGISVIVALTALSLRLAGPVLWGVLIGLPLLSLAMLGRVDVALLGYGLVITVAWLINAISVPVYYGNFVEGSLGVNRTSHAVMLVGAAALGAPAGFYFGGLGVIVGTSLAIALGSLFLLASRQRDLAAMRYPFTRSDYAVNVIGLAGASSVYLVAMAAVPLERKVYVAIIAGAIYCATSTQFVMRRAAEHLQRVAG